MILWTWVSNICVEKEPIKCGGFLGRWHSRSENVGLQQKAYTLRMGGI
jgi:hypothetical protein